MILFILWYRRTNKSSLDILQTFIKVMPHLFHLNHSNLHHQRFVGILQPCTWPHYIPSDCHWVWTFLYFLCTVCVHVYNILEILTSVDRDCEILTHFLVESPSLNLRNSLQLKSKFELTGLNQFLEFIFKF